MKTNELNLELQAWVDGQLEQLEVTPARRAEIGRLALGDPAARELVAGLRSVSAVLKGNVPEHSVPASREFYWSQIQRRIATAERVEARVAPAAGTGRSWLRWLLPLGGAAALAVTLAVNHTGRVPSSAEALADVGSDESGAVVFRSEAEGLTICWLD